MLRHFNPSSSHPARAAQAWQILVGRAMNRQTLTYKGLSELMYRKPAAGVLNEILLHVAFFCIDHDLPPLTSIVVNAGGVPGAGIPVDPSAIDGLREEVYTRDWYDVHPPSEEELAAAFARSR
jgi:hypothetical protein